VRRREGLDVAALTSAYSVSNTSELLPEPETPVTTTSSPSDVEVEVGEVVWRAPRMRIVRRASADTAWNRRIGGLGAGLQRRGEDVT